MWQDYMNAFLGFCVLILAFLDVSAGTLQWALGIIGALIMIVGLWGGTVNSAEEEGEQSRRIHV